jgi:HEAT repeat protein
MLRDQLESGEVSPAHAIAQLIKELGAGMPRASRTQAYQLVGDLAGRAFDAPWEVAEQAAWVLLGAALSVDSPGERRELLRAIGRGFRNLWLVPIVHARLGDEDPETAAAAIEAAGGLGFPGLQTAVAGFLDDATPPDLRLAAIRALGRAGATGPVARLAQLVNEEPRTATAALTALAEIHSPAAVETARARLAGNPPREVTVAAVHYLGEMGDTAVLPFLRRLGRSADPELRRVAGNAARSLQAAARKDVSERLLAALTDSDRVVRAALARRLRPMVADDVLAEAEILLEEDAEGVVQVLAELRGDEATHFLLKVARDTKRSEIVRARAVGAIAADEVWERDALLKVALDEAQPERVRVSAAQALGAFVTLDELLERLRPLAEAKVPALRGAYVWAAQLVARPKELNGKQRKQLEDQFKKMLTDEDPGVRRRSAYVTGNLRLDSLLPLVVDMAQKEESRPELRTAAFVALQELATGATLGSVVALFRREDDPAVLVPASRAVQAAARRGAVKPDVTHLSGKLGKLIDDADPRKREAAVRVAGLTPGALPISRVVAAASDAAPRVREAALASLGKLLASGAADDAALEVLREGSTTTTRRSASAPPRRCWRPAARRPSAGSSTSARARVTAPAGRGGEQAHGSGAARGHHAAGGGEGRRATLGRRPGVGAAGPATHVAARDQRRGGGRWRGCARRGHHQAVPDLAEAGRGAGVRPLARSLRTAEALYRNAALSDGDPSPPIILWMKCLEGYVHAWLSRKLQQKQNQLLWDHVEQLASGIWPTYSRWLGPKWAERVDVGGLKVEMPLRAVPNALRDLLGQKSKEPGFAAVDHRVVAAHGAARCRSPERRAERPRDQLEERRARGGGGAQALVARGGAQRGDAPDHAPAGDGRGLPQGLLYRLRRSDRMA